MGGTTSLTASGALRSQLPKPGGKPSELRSGGMPSRAIWTCLESIPPTGGGSRSGFARCPQSTSSVEEASKVHACLSSGDAVWLADQDKGIV